MTETSHPAEPRRQALLEAALMIFVRFGYRKTSMDEVARAAGVSRQGLYLHFANKEELFRATILHALTRQYENAVACLGDPQRPADARLVDALDAWMGRYVGMMGADAGDLVEASGTLSPDSVTRYETRFTEALTAQLAQTAHTGVPAIAADQIAQTLYATAVGIKHRAASHQEFLRALRIAVHVITRIPPAADDKDMP